METRRQIRVENHLSYSPLFPPTSEVEDGRKYRKEYSHIEWEIMLGHDQRLDKSKAIAVYASPATSSRSLHSSLPVKFLKNTSPPSPSTS